MVAGGVGDVAMRYISTEVARACVTIWRLARRQWSHQKLVAAALSF